MAEDKDFIDIRKRGRNNLRRIRLTPEDLDMIRDNPGGLTKEGSLMRIKQWSLSNNQHVLFRYLAMFKNCENFTTSGKTTDGKIILARRKHVNKGGLVESSMWTEKEFDENGIKNVDVEMLTKLANERSKELVFLTNKGG